MRNLKKLAIVSTIAAGMALAVTAQAGDLSNLPGLQLKPLMGDAFQRPGTGVSFGGHNFVVHSPANCVDTGDGLNKTCSVVLDHLCQQKGYYLVVDQTMHPKTKKVLTQVSAYPDHTKVLLTYTQRYIPGTALNIVSVQPQHNF